ncbi:MAG: protein kinase [Candidatus Sericytochromatia bacterium]
MIILEKYQIIEEVGRGGMGLVYKALDLRLGRTVALKELVISPTIIGVEKDDIVARFKQEAQTAAFLNHPNIITIYDVGEENNRHFIAMEFLPGKTLKDYLDEDYKYTTDELLDILIQIASGLDHAHSKGIIHRDIKPDNMKILNDNVVKITDFGIARIESSTSNLTQDGTMLGTLGYISPEQLHNSKGVDTRADIFSFGAMMYEIYTKKLPFDGGTVGSTILKIMTENPVPPKKINPDIDDDIEKIIMKCLEKDPNTRYQKLKDVVQELTLIKALAGKKEKDQKEQSKSQQVQNTLPPVNPNDIFYNNNVSLLKNSVNNIPNRPPENFNNLELNKPELNTNDNKNLYSNMMRTTLSSSASQAPIKKPEPTNPPLNKISYPPIGGDPKSLYNNQSSISSKPTPSLNQSNITPMATDIKIAFVRMFGKSGISKGDFSSPKGLAVSNDGMLFVADTQNRRVQAFNGFGNWQYNIQVSEMQSPVDIAFDSSNKIYVIDSNDCHIRVFDFSGNLITKFAGKGTGSGQLKSLSGISICNDKIYVTDTEGYRVCVFALTGQMTSVFGKFGTRPGEYKSPYSITSDESKIYILDYGFPRVQVIDKDGISRLVFGERGTAKGQFSIPKGISVDKFGRIYVCDTLNHRVQVFDRTGKWIYSFGSKGNGQGQFMGPEAISISNDSHIYVLDKGNSRVQVFTYDI